MMVSLKYLSNFWTTLKTSLINCKINLVITWFANSSIITNSIDGHVPTFAINNAKLSVSAVTLSTENNAKLLQQLNYVLKEQLIGININYKQKCRQETNIYITLLILVFKK